MRSTILPFHAKDMKRPKGNSLISHMNISGGWYTWSRGNRYSGMARQSDTATLAAHLLYWSTMYAIKTHGQHRKLFSVWLDNLENNVQVKHEIEPEYLSESFRRKQCKYWRETVGEDSAISWSSNLSILKKKHEFNIGYWRYVQHYVGWQEDVNRMKIAINLMEIAKTDWHDIKGKHINLWTADRYTYEQEHGGDLHELYLGKLYRHKKLFKFKCEVH